MRPGQVALGMKLAQLVLGVFRSTARRERGAPQSCQPRQPIVERNRRHRPNVLRWSRLSLFEFSAPEVGFELLTTVTNLPKVPFRIPQDGCFAALGTFDGHEKSQCTLISCLNRHGNFSKHNIFHNLARQATTSQTVSEESAQLSSLPPTQIEVRPPDTMLKLHTFRTRRRMQTESCCTRTCQREQKCRTRSTKS